ncbi:MAG: hypothetical protein ACHQ51_05480 [Elusimicrobiota bacterium]
MLALLCAAVSPARAAKDEFAELKPLLGSWLVDKECGTNKERLLVVFTRHPKYIHMEFSNPLRPDTALGSADLFAHGVPGHFHSNVALPDNPVLKSIGATSLPRNLVVSDDPDEPEGPGKDYLTCSASVGPFSSLMTIKLRDKYRKATFIFTDESPISRDRCRGSGVKQKTKPKAE